MSTFQRGPPPPPFLCSFDQAHAGLLRRHDDGCFIITATYYSNEADGAVNSTVEGCFAPEHLPKPCVAGMIRSQSPILSLDLPLRLSA